MLPGVRVGLDGPAIGRQDICEFSSKGDEGGNIWPTRRGEGSTELVLSSLKVSSGPADLERLMEGGGASFAVEGSSSEKAGSRGSLVPNFLFCCSSCFFLGATRIALDDKEDFSFAGGLRLDPCADVPAILACDGTVGNLLFSSGIHH